MTALPHERSNSSPSVVQRFLTTAMLSCFALAGWLWLHESAPKHDQAIAAVPRPSGSGLAVTSTRPLVPSTQPLPDGRGTVNSSPSVSDDESARSAAEPRYVTKNIEDIRLGQRLVGRNPLRHETSAPSDIDSAHWRAVRLTMLQGGVFYELAFLRSLEWLDRSDAKVGQHIDLVMPEMGLLGPALVESIQPCPTIEPDDGTGRMIVTGTMKHLATNVLELTITGLDEPLGVTTTHPIWSEDLQAFVPAGQLTEGEHLRTANGQQTQLTRITPKRGPPEQVYNLEVDAEHVYHVAGSGLLVHNDCPFAMGIDDHLDAFASAHGATTWKKFDDVGDWQNKVKEKLADPNTPVLFNLDGVDVWGGLSRAGSNRGGATDWELLQIFNNPNYPNLQFFKNGLPAANPFK